MSGEKVVPSLLILNLGARLGECVYLADMMRMGWMDDDPKTARECLIKIGARAEQISRDVQDAVRGF